MSRIGDQTRDTLRDVPGKGSDRKGGFRMPDTPAWNDFVRNMTAAGVDRSDVFRSVVYWLNREAEGGPAAVRAALERIGMRFPDEPAE